MIAVNARFRLRPATGVDVHAAEVLRLLDGVEEVTPPATWRSGVAATAWEQVALRAAMRRRTGPDRAPRVLWSPCNTGPVTRRPHVITVQDVGPLEHPEWYSRGYAARARWLDARTATHASVIAAGSAFSAGRITAILGVPPERIRVVGNGVRHELLAAVPPAQAWPHARAERPTIVALGSLTPWKGQTRLVEAVRRVGRDAELIIVGGSNQRVMAPPPSPWSSDSTSRHGPFRSGDGRGGPVVRFTGRLPLDDVIETLRRAWAVVSLSRYEGFDLPPVEAAALGVPTVVSDIEVHRETLGGVDGVHFVSSDSDLDAAIETAIDGRLPGPDADQVRRRHCWSDVADRYVDIFRDLGDLDVRRSAPPPTRST